MHCVFDKLRNRQKSIRVNEQKKNRQTGEQKILSTNNREEELTEDQRVDEYIVDWRIRVITDIEAILVKKKITRVDEQKNYRRVDKTS